MNDRDNLMSLLEKVEAITDRVCVTERSDRIIAAVDEALRIRRQLNRQRGLRLFEIPARECSSAG